MTSKHAEMSLWRGHCQQKDVAWDEMSTCCRVCCPRGICQGYNAVAGCCLAGLSADPESSVRPAVGYVNAGASSVGQ